MFTITSPYKDRVPSSDSADRDTDAESLLEKVDVHPTRQQTSRDRLQTICWAIASHCLVFAIALFLGGHFFRPDLSSYVDRIQHWSPVRKDVDMGYHTVQFNGSFMHQNIYRQDAGPEVDAAWEALGVDYRALAVPEEDARRSGLTESHVRINPKYGGGYPANVEGLHHLHCLNLLRKSLVWNYDHYLAIGKGAFSNEQHVVKVHVTHCLDVLRQQLMCTVDTGVLGQVWWGTEEKPNPFVDFNTQHQCRDYEAVRKWAEARQLPPADETPADFLLQPRGPEDILSEIP